MNIFFITRHIPFTPQSGIELRIYNLLKCLSKANKVTCVFLCDDIQKSQKKLSKCDLPISIHLISNEHQSAFRYVYHLWEVIFISEKCRSAIDHLVDLEKPEIFWMDFGYICHFARFLKKYNLPIVFGTHNAQFSLDYNIWKTTNNYQYKLKMAPFVAIYKLHELLFLKDNDMIICISKNDMEYYRNFLPSNKLYHLPFIFGDEHIMQMSPLQLDKPYICVVGSLQSYQNYEAVLFVLENVWPTLQPEHPDLLLYIVGELPQKKSAEYAELQHKIAKLQNVILTGHVDSVIPYVKGALLNVAPILMGSGVRTKIVESIACKTPVVSTTIGAEGLPLVNGVSICIADGGMQLKEAISTLVADRQIREQMANKAYQIYTDEFSIDAGIKKVERLLNEVLAQKQTLQQSIFCCRE